MVLLLGAGLAVLILVVLFAAFMVGMMVQNA